MTGKRIAAQYTTDTEAVLRKTYDAVTPEQRALLLRGDDAVRGTWEDPLLLKDLMCRVIQLENVNWRAQWERNPIPPEAKGNIIENPIRRRKVKRGVVDAFGRKRSGRTARPGQRVPTPA